MPGEYKPPYRQTGRYQNDEKAVCGLSLSKESRENVRRFLKEFPVKKHRVEHARLAFVSNSVLKADRSTTCHRRKVPSPIFLNEKTEKKRTLLPAFECKMQVMECLRNNRVMFITGGTGCGKTTQVPQYILEQANTLKKPLRIFCTQPRRLPAISVAKRVCFERNEKLGATVGYHIRLDNSTSEDTILTYCTTGILLRKLSVPSVVNSITHIILDEVHERGIDMDCILIALKDILKSHQDLKVVLMSATMESSLKKLEDFFKDFTVGRVKIQSRLFDVKELYLPEILALITLNSEVSTGERRLSHKSGMYGRPVLSISNEMREALSDFKTAFPDQKVSFDREIADELTQFNWKREQMIQAYKSKIFIQRRGTTLVVRLIDYLLKSRLRGAILVFLPGINEIMAVRDELSMLSSTSTPFNVYILHSLTDDSDQEGVFIRVPGFRKVILSTNIAEASVTIDDVVFVIDSGVAKQNVFDHSSRASELKLMWIAKSNAAQRKGRTGRCKNGYCFRLYTEQDYENMREVQLPEIERASLHDVVLHAKLFACEGTSVKEFLAMAPDPPSIEAIDHSIAYLMEIDAMAHGSTDNGLILTKLGEFIARMPLEAKLSRMLFFGVVLKCLGPIVDVVSVLAYGDPYVISLDEESDEANVARDELGHRDFSDHLMLIRALGVYLKCSDAEGRNTFCKEKFFRPFAMQMISGIRKQLVSEMKLMQILPPNFKDHGSSEYNKFGGSWPMVQAAVVAGAAIARKSARLEDQKSQCFQTGEKSNAFLHFASLVKRHMVASKHYKNSIAQYADYERDPNVEFLAYQELSKLKDGNTMKTVTAVPPLTAFLFSGSLSISDDTFEKIFAPKPEDEDSTEPLAKGVQMVCGLTDWLSFSGDFDLMQSLLKLRFKIFSCLLRMLEGGDKFAHSKEYEASLECINSVLSCHHKENYFDECDIFGSDSAS